MQTFGQFQLLKVIKSSTLLVPSSDIHWLCNSPMIYLPDGCEANIFTFILPSNNHLNVDSDIKTSENKFGFNSSYSKIENFNLMQALNISNFYNTYLQAIANKIPEMKDSSILSINSTLTKPRSFPTKHWSAHILQIVPTILAPLTIVMVLITANVG